MSGELRERDWVVANIRSLHRPIPEGSGGTGDTPTRSWNGPCRADGSAWPCDAEYAARLLADTPSVEPGEWTPEELEPFAPKNETGLMLGVAIGALFQSGRNEAHLASCPVARDVIWIIGRRPTAPSVEPAGPEVRSGERLARIIQEADDENPEWARGARFVLGWTKGPDDSALEAAFRAVRDPALLPTQASDSPEPKETT